MEVQLFFIQFVIFQPFDFPVSMHFDLKDKKMNSTIGTSKAKEIKDPLPKTLKKPNWTFNYCTQTMNANLIRSIICYLVGLKSWLYGTLNFNIIVTY